MGKPSPIFVVPPNAPSRSVEENVAFLGTVAHVCEVKGAYALVHSSPAGVVRITEFGLPVFHSKRGGEYFAVRIARALSLVPSLVPPIQRPAPPPLVLTPSPGYVSGIGAVNRLVIRGWQGELEYHVTETRTKRRQDNRRWEVRKLDGDPSLDPYIVTFQDDSCACSCPSWIYRRQQCKHIRAIRSAFGVRQSFARVG